MALTLAEIRSSRTLPRRPEQSRPRRRRASGLSDYGFLVPMVVVFVVLIAIPLARSVWFSLTDFNGYSTDMSFVGAENYARIFRNGSMLAGLGFTFVYALGTTLAVTVFAIPLAVVLNRRFFARNFVRAAFFFPAIPSIAVLGLVWGFILSPLGSGLINSVLETTIGAGPFGWLSDPLLAQISVIAVGVWSQTGWHAILYLAYLQSIPSDYYEAATLDGASRTTQFRYITLPLLAPAITVSQMLLLTGGLKVYDLPYTLTGGGPGYSTYTLTQSIIMSGIAQAKYGEASALAVLFMLLVAVVITTQLVISRRIERRLS